MTLTKEKPLVLNRTNKTLMEQVYYILDSNLQRVENDAQSCYKHCCEKSPKKNASIISSNSQASDTMLLNFEQMLQQIAMLDKKRKLLQILRSWLEENNVCLILTLLTNNRYLTFTEDRLEYLIKRKSYSNLSIA